jgi:hypothetical protein
MLRANRIATDAAASSFSANAASALAVPLAYAVQLRLIVTHFDHGGALALDWKKGTQSLGEPLKINTWTQFYRATGPPVIARTAAVIASFYIAGNVHAWVTVRNNPPPPPPKKERAKRRT